MPKSVVARMRRERKKGLSYAAIADKLNEAGVPTAQGGRRWYPATVRYALAETSDAVAVGSGPRSTPVDEVTLSRRC
jgi:hypothetical protein